MPKFFFHCSLFYLDFPTSILFHTVADPGIFNGGGAEDEWVSPSPPGEGSEEGARPPPQKNFEFGALKCRILVQSGALL